MNRYVKGESREQLRLEPLCFDDMIAEENHVRAIDAIVESMDILTLGFEYSKTKATGRMPYDPKDMFKLYAYSYFNGIRSSRKIERECHRNIEVMWLIKELKPDFKTIANFRKDNKKAIKAAFRKFTMICDELGLISKEVVAIDGSKFRACNGRIRYHSKGKIAEKLLHYNDVAEKYINLLEQCDKQEEESKSAQYNKDELKAKLEKINKRITELEEISELVEENGTIYLTDSDARLMRTHNGGGDISHNVQTAVEAKSHIVVAVDAVSDAVDYAQLHNIASKAKEELAVDELVVIADRGYYSADEFVKCKGSNIKPITPKPDRGSNAQSGGYTKTYFKYDKERDIYICPQGKELFPPKNRRSKNPEIRYSNANACKDCKAKDSCVKKSKYRYVTRGKNDSFADEVDAYTKENAKLFSKRKELVEHPFGTIKRALGYTYFLTCGTENVLTESYLHFLAYNVKRLINIMGTTELVARLQG
jgi:transposase